MATTLTLYLGVWPRGYLLQVGDSRGYLLRDGELTQITRDQTMAQEMVDLGVMKSEEAAATRLAHTLTSSIGGSQTDPKVTRFDMAWGHVLLLCSDGLTRQVPDTRIRDVLGSMTSARQACETLLQEALDARRQRQHHDRGRTGDAARSLSGFAFDGHSRGVPQWLPRRSRPSSSALKGGIGRRSRTRMRTWPCASPMTPAS